MAERFVDRQATNPGLYKLSDGTQATYLYIERFDSPTVEGTPLNAATFNAILDELDGKVSASEPIVLTEGIHYGDTLPTAGTKGRFFLLRKVTE